MKTQGIPSLRDTIAAIATFPSSSALGVIKLSGPDAVSIVHRIFVPRRKKDIRKVPTYSLHYGWITDGLRAGTEKAESRRRQRRRLLSRPQRGPKEQDVIDEVLVSVMRKPRSYTAEDVVEISSHGGVLIMHKIMQVLIRCGARQAQPGEFSYRAFINGRIDLIQAQAVSDIIEAKTDKALFSLSRQLNGEFSQTVLTLKQDLTDVCARLEAQISFPDEEIPVDNKAVMAELRNIKKKVDSFLVSGESSRLLREGLRCVICGKANVGKSTIFNLLLREERTLVTHIAGTTRDVSQETIIMRGIPLRMYDTAGILDPADVIDKEAMKRSYEALHKADIRILVFDYSRPLQRHDRFLLKKIKGETALFVVNKTDLPGRLNIKEIRGYKKPVVMMSALRKEGVSRLEEKIAAHALNHGFSPKDNPVFLNSWQMTLLKEISASVSEAIAHIRERYPLDYLVFILSPAVRKLGRLTGQEADEMLLQTIFSRFCIGK